MAYVRRSNDVLTVIVKQIIYKNKWTEDDEMAKFLPDLCFYFNAKLLCTQKLTNITLFM